MSSSRLIVLAVLLLQGACGFQLRSAVTLPAQMERTYIETDDRHSQFYRTLARRLEASGVDVVENPADATAVFAILRDETDQRVLSVSARNVPREYEVYYSITYSVQADGRTLLGPQPQTATRDYTWNETQVLGKAREEELLREALVQDLVRIVLVQLSTVR